MINNLSNSIKTAVSLGAQADGTGTVSGAILDMAGYRGVRFIAKFDDVDNGAVLTLQAQQGAANSASAMATLSGNATYTAAAADADDKLLILDVVAPDDRYVRPQVVIGSANGTLACIISEQYGANDLPITQDSSVIDHDTLGEPAEA